MRGLPSGTVTLTAWAGNEFKPATIEIAAGSDGVTITLERNPPHPRESGKGR